MNEFEKCAREYCEVKIRYNELRRKIWKLPCTEECASSWGDGGTTPCWYEYRDGGITIEEACENCATSIPMAEERSELGKRLPNLAKAMYRAFREEK